MNDQESQTESPLQGKVAGGALELVQEALPVEAESELTSVIKTLLEFYVTQLTAPKPATTPLIVDDIASHVAKFYELIRKVIDWKEDNALRRSAIERILKRLLFTKISSLTLTSDLHMTTIAETLTLDLIRGGHLPNGVIPREKVSIIATILTKYVSFIEHAQFSSSDPLIIKRKINFDTFIIELAACEIEELLTEPFIESSLIHGMTQAMMERISVRPPEAMTEDEKYIQTYIAVCRTLFDLDDGFITYHLLLFQYSDWKNPSPERQKELDGDITIAWQQIEAILKHPFAKQFYVACERVDTVFALIGDVLTEYKEKPRELKALIAQKQAFLAKIGQYYDKRFATLKKRLFRLAVFSTLSVFVSNWFTYFIIEVPLASLFAEGFNLFTAIIDFVVPTAIMFGLVAIIRPPPASNRKHVLDAVEEFVYAGFSPHYYEIKAKATNRPIMSAFIGTVFTGATVILIGAVGWIFWVARLPITSVAFDTFTITLTVFAAVIIRNKSKELTVGDKTTVTEFFLDMISVPMAGIGSVLASKWKEYNVVAFLLTFLVETPFAKVIDLIEQWSQLIKERRADLH